MSTTSVGVSHDFYFNFNTDFYSRALYYQIKDVRILMQNCKVLRFDVLDLFADLEFEEVSEVAEFPAIYHFSKIKKKLCYTCTGVYIYTPVHVT